MTLDEFFQSYEGSRPYFDAVRELIDSIGPMEMRISKSQIAFWRHKAAARVWIPARYLQKNCAPLVLTLCFDQRAESPRWKEIVEPAPGRYVHHLEIWSLDDIDGQVREWLQQAYR
jgi:hypothetical protein